jgi:hypothetical protein
MKCEHCWEEGRHHPWCETVTGVTGQQRLARDATRDNTTYGPSPTAWLMEQFVDPSGMELPELSADQDLQELEVTDDMVVDMLMGHNMDDVNRERSESVRCDEVIISEPVVNPMDGLVDPELDACGLMRIVTGPVGPNTPEESESEDGSWPDSDSQWVLAQELAGAMVRHVDDTGMEPPLRSNIAIPDRMANKDFRPEPEMRLGEEASCSTSVCPCGDCRYRYRDGSINTGYPSARTGAEPNLRCWPKLLMEYHGAGDMPRD